MEIRIKKAFFASFFSRHEVNLNRSNSHLYGSRNGNLSGNAAGVPNGLPAGVISATAGLVPVGVPGQDFLDSPPSPPGNRKTSYTREYVRNLPTTVSGHSAPATRGRLTRRSQTLVRDSSINSFQDHSSYSSQSSDKSENGGLYHQNIPGNGMGMAPSGNPGNPAGGSDRNYGGVISGTVSGLNNSRGTLSHMGTPAREINSYERHNPVTRETSYDRASKVISSDGAREIKIQREPSNAKVSSGSSNEQYSYESRPRINSQTFRLVRMYSSLPNKRTCTPFLILTKLPPCTLLFGTASIFSKVSPFMNEIANFYPAL